MFLVILRCSAVGRMSGVAFRDRIGLRLTVAMVIVIMVLV